MINLYWTKMLEDVEAACGKNEAQTLQNLIYKAKFNKDYKINLRTQNDPVHAGDPLTYCFDLMKTDEGLEYWMGINHMVNRYRAIKAAKKVAKAAAGIDNKRVVIFDPGY